MEHHHETNNTALNWFLTFCVGVFTLVEESSADQIYTWIFRVLSLFSLILIIIINWNKAMKVIFNNDK